MHKLALLFVLRDLTAPARPWHEGEDFSERLDLHPIAATKEPSRLASIKAAGRARIAARLHRLADRIAPLPEPVAMGTMAHGG